MNRNLSQKFYHSFAYFIKLFSTGMNSGDGFLEPIPINDLVDIHEECCECIECCITKWTNQYGNLYLKYYSKFFLVLPEILLNINNITAYEIADSIYTRYFTMEVSS